MSVKLTLEKNGPILHSRNGGEVLNYEKKVMPRE